MSSSSCLVGAASTAARKAGVSFGAGDGLDQAQQGFGSGHVSEVVFAIRSGQFQSVTVCHRLTSLLGKSLFQLVPVLPGGLKVRLLGEDLDDIDDGEEPCVGLFVVDAADGVAFERGGDDVHGGTLRR